MSLAAKLGNSQQGYCLNFTVKRQEWRSRRLSDPSPGKDHNYLHYLLTSLPENIVSHGPREEVGCNTMANIYWKDTHILPQRELPPFILDLTVCWKKENTKIFQGLLDRWSELTSTCQEPKHHHGPPIKMHIWRSGQVKSWFVVYHLVLQTLQ